LCLCASVCGRCVWSTVRGAWGRNTGRGLILILEYLTHTFTTQREWDAWLTWTARVLSLVKCTDPSHGSTATSTDSGRKRCRMRSSSSSSIYAELRALVTFSEALVRSCGPRVSDPLTATTTHPASTISSSTDRTGSSGESEKDAALPPRCRYACVHESPTVCLSRLALRLADLFIELKTIQASLSLPVPFEAPFGPRVSRGSAAAGAATQRAIVRLLLRSAPLSSPSHRCR
jgi:hypothetical protein